MKDDFDLWKTNQLIDTCRDCRLLRNKIACKIQQNSRLSFIWILKTNKKIVSMVIYFEKYRLSKG